MAFIDKDNLTIVRRKKKDVKGIEPYNISKLKIFVEAGEAKTVAPLSGILGQFGVNTVEFCKRFNEMSKVFEEELPVAVVVFKKSDGSFGIEIKGPSLAFLLWVLLLDEDDLSIIDFYDLVRLMLRRLPDYNLQQVAGFIFGTFLSGNLLMNIKI